MDIINIAAQIVGVLSSVVCVCKLAYELVVFFTKKMYIKKLLLFKRGECYISQAVYKKEVMKAECDYVTVQEMVCFQKLQYMLHEVGYKAIPYKNDYFGNNVIHIGGPSANENVNSILMTKSYSFSIYASIKNEDTLKMSGMDTTRYHFTNDEGYIIKIGEFELKFTNNTDYGIFIRIPACKEDGIDYTTHIIFGGWADGTLAAVEFYTRNYKMISNKFQRGRYCFAVKISRVNNSTELIRNGDIIDLTSNFFADGAEQPVGF